MNSLCFSAWIQPHNIVEYHPSSNLITKNINKRGFEKALNEMTLLISRQSKKENNKRNKHSANNVSQLIVSRIATKSVTLSERKKLIEGNFSQNQKIKKIDDERKSGNELIVSQIITRSQSKKFELMNCRTRSQKKKVS